MKRKLGSLSFLQEQHKILESNDKTLSTSVHENLLYQKKMRTDTTGKESPLQNVFAPFKGLFGRKKRNNVLNFVLSLPRLIKKSSTPKRLHSPGLDSNKSRLDGFQAPLPLKEEKKDSFLVWTQENLNNSFSGVKKQSSQKKKNSRSHKVVSPLHIDSSAFKENKPYFLRDRRLSEAGANIKTEGHMITIDSDSPEIFDLILSSSNDERVVAGHSLKTERNTLHKEEKKLLPLSEAKSKWNNLEENDFESIRKFSSTDDLSLHLYRTRLDDAEQNLQLLREKVWQPNHPKERFRLLNGSENQVIDFIYSRKHPKNEVLSHITEANISLKRSDFLRLKGSKWLNDEIINAYMALLNSRNRKLRGENSNRRLHVHCFNSFFYTILAEGPEGYNYEKVKRWTTRSDVDVIKADRVIFPVNLSNYHWVLVCIDLKNEKFMYLDSMHHGDRRGILDTMRKWLTDEVTCKHGTQKAKALGISSWKKTCNENISKQNDGGSCGVFVTLFAECLERNDVMDVTQETIKILRLRMTLDLFMGKLPSF